MNINREMTKGARFSFYLMLFLLGGLFWIATKTGHFTMDEAVYGRAVDYPAAYWAAAMMFPSAGYIAALFINGRRWWTAPVRIMIGSWMIGYFIAFVWCAMPSAGVDIIVIASAVMALKAALMSMFDLGDMRRRRRLTHGRG